MSPVYKHAAPLGLQKKGKREGRFPLAIHIALRWSESWVFLGLSCINPILHTCRPAGAWVARTCRPSINMPPRWGFRRKENEKTGQIPACYTHCAPLERKPGFSRFIVHQFDPTHMSPVYKHAAPLGLNPPMECFPGSTFDTTLHSAGVRGLGLSRLL